MVKFTATLYKYETHDHMNGWVWLEIPADLATQLKPGHKKEFKVKGKLDSYALTRVSVMPLGGGRFILPVNAAMRKAIGKKEGAMVKLQLEEDRSAFVFNADFMACLQDEPAAQQFFATLSGSHQRYFSKWIDSAKTEPTRIKRIALAVSSLAKKWDYGQMIRSQKKAD
jgi:Domain of unknown function (DUF1905)/Bacteriocin-protection, YdeI or OmpD-Associated